MAQQEKILPGVAEVFGSDLGPNKSEPKFSVRNPCRERKERKEREGIGRLREGEGGRKEKKRVGENGFLLLY